LRLRSLFRRNEIERDLEDEIAFHLAMQAEANRQAGMSEHEATRAAYRQFGSVAREQEACRDHIFGGSGSMVSFIVVQRTREIGIRMALGAQIPQIKRLVIRQSMKLIAAGIGIGIPAFLMLSRFFSTLLFGIGAADPLTMSAVLIVVSTVGWMAAAYLPARRAARIDPMRTLRAD
jgi:hypothetical protein